MTFELERIKILRAPELLIFAYYLFWWRHHFFQFIFCNSVLFWHAIFHALYHTIIHNSACLNDMPNQEWNFAVPCITVDRNFMNHWLLIISCMRLLSLEVVEKLYVVANCEWRKCIQNRYYMSLHFVKNLFISQRRD